MKNFALIGAAGYIAPRHMQAIKDTGNRLVCALDPHDSVGVLDSYFDDVEFFTEFERFDRHVNKLSKTDRRINYVSICSPNYLHDAHIRFALRSGANAICEKPLVINDWNIEGLQEIERDMGLSINCILQLRLHESIKQLKQMVSKSKKAKFNVNLSYITPRGKWYEHSWKGNDEKSGGILTNIGIHFLDMLLWIFGNVEGMSIRYSDKMKVHGHLELKRADVEFFFSIDVNDIRKMKTPKYRSINVDGDEIDFTLGFDDLHTISYKKILCLDGFRINEVAPAIELACDLKRHKPLRVV